MENDETLMQLEFADPKSVQFSIDSYQKITYRNTAENVDYYDVDIKLMFPLTNKNEFIAVYHENNEVALIKDYRQLSDESREIALEALEKRYFIPEIIKVNRVVQEYRIVHWYVETNKGELDFYTRTRNDVVVKDKKVYIRDIDSNRYLIKDYTALSLQSQKELSSEI